MNAGRRLQVHWRWNGKPLRVRVRRTASCDEHGLWKIEWERWHPRGGWRVWRSYGYAGQLRDAIRCYRDYADEWRGFQ